MFTPLTAREGQRRRRERRVHLSDWVQKLQSELHWDSYFSRCPEAARTALEEVKRIVDEELRALEQRRRLVHA